MNGPRQATVMTHRRPNETAHALGVLMDAARGAGVTLRFDENETRKHGLAPADGIVVDAPVEKDVEVCLVLGGDGSILTALRGYAGTDVPVFAVNFGHLGFLATIEPEQMDVDCPRAFSGSFETLALPAISLPESSAEGRNAMNDVSVHRKPGGRVAQLAYAVGGEEIGRVRCDGLVVATPAGSTGYNLANGGPILAWGVEGFVVSFIAPHSLTARALVVAPTDVLSVHNRSPEERVDMSVDGHLAGELGPGESIELRFLPAAALLAQVPSSSFYSRMREKFGRLAGLDGDQAREVPERTP